ncbi:hypothetical protein AAV98_10735 [Bacillus sp. CHD6a]|nr:hypothetical protein AAV98_10735 [Bacillus sp. CHD6a]
MNRKLADDWSKRRRLLSEIALGGDPAGVAEEAPAVPLGKRSHLRKSTAVFKEKKSCTFQWPRIAEEAPAASPGKRSQLRKSSAVLYRNKKYGLCSTMLA